ncbi:MAG: DUF58 domain-containing protein [Pseudomonadota bacterium]
MHTVADQQHSFKNIEAKASALARTMPELFIEAQKVAHTVAYGVHGRRRAGPGETFWQFRHYQHGDALNQVDWRRSAGSDILYVRQREWEAAHTMWIWPDMSTGMQFQSHLAPMSKEERGLIITFALSELLIKAGERVGLLGLSTPMIAQNAPQRMAEILINACQQNRMPANLPPENVNISASSECILLSDCLEPVDTFIDRCTRIAALGVRGHIVQILDPVEETFPYEGRIEFHSTGGAERVLFHKAQNVKQAYQKSLADHKAELQMSLKALGWTYCIHHTDRPAGELLLNLYTKVSGTQNTLSYPGIKHTKEDDGYFDTVRVESGANA